MAAVRLEKVTRFYGRRGDAAPALVDLSLDVRDGELVVLVGPSGCGKTTTLRLVAGLEQPDAGRILLDDRDVRGAAPRDRDVAMVFQGLALYPHMTVQGNLDFPLKMRGAAKADRDRRVGEVAHMLGIDHLLQRLPGTLSGGEQQRVAVGRAIVRHPRVFLLDEPLASLDAPQRLAMRREIRELQRRLATTMIYVTHDQEEAMTLGDRIAVLNHGRLQQFGEPLDLYHQPANRFVAGFLGSPPMSFLNGRIEREGERVRFVGTSLCVALPADASASLCEAAPVSVVAGIRPEDIRLTDAHLAASAPSPKAPKGLADPAWPADVPTARMDDCVVESVEPLGSTTFVYVRSPCGETLAVRCPSTPAHPRDRVHLLLRGDRLRLFADNESGCRLV